MSSDGNPYKSPQKVEESGVGHGSRWANMVDAGAIIKAVAIAVVAMFAIGLIKGMVLWGLEATDFPTDDMTENLYAPEVFFFYLFFFFCLELFTNVIGGYIAAAIAGRNFLLHGVVTGTILLAISGVFYLFSDDEPFTIMEGILLLLPVPLAAAGGAIRQRIQRSKDSAE